MKKRNTVNLNNARTHEQRAVMKDIVAKGVCPFCPEELTQFHKKPIIKEGDFWILTENQWPYKNTQVHLLAILKKHGETLIDLPEGAGEELIELFKWAEKKYRITGGGFAMRFGDISINGATVRHLHAQIIFPKQGDEPPRFYVGSRREKEIS